MTHKMDLFDQASFKTLSKPIPISLGDESKVFATGKGTIRLLFNVDGKSKEGKFKDVLYVPDLKVTLLSVRQSARLPHCKVVFDNNVCEYIDKNTKEVIARAYASGSVDLYTLDATPVSHKVAANLASSSSRSINVNILHRWLGHLRADNCRLMIKRQLVDGVDNVVGKEEFCKGCAYSHSKRKPHPLTGTRTKRRLERVHVDICGPLPNSLGKNRYFLLIIDKHTHHHWVEILSKKSDAFPHLQRWKLWAERETDLKLQYLKSDGGKEFRSKAFEEWLAADGVVHEISAPYKHEQNGLAKGGYRMSPRGPCASCSERICWKVSGHTPLKPQSTSLIAAQPRHSLTRPPTRHGQENDLTSDTYAPLEKLAMYTSHWRRERNGLRRLARVDFLDTQRGRETTGYGILNNTW